MFGFAGEFPVVRCRRCGPLWPSRDLPRQYCHDTPRTRRALLERTGWRIERLSLRRRGHVARRTARVMPLATASPWWRAAASNRLAAGLLSRATAILGGADEIRAVARA